MGATLALAYAVKKNPDKIKSLILIGPGPVKGSNLFILRDNRFSRTTKVDEELIKQWNDSIKKEPGNRKGKRGNQKNTTSMEPIRPSESGFNFSKN